MRKMKKCYGKGTLTTGREILELVGWMQTDGPGGLIIIPLQLELVLARRLGVLCQSPR